MPRRTTLAAASVVLMCLALPGSALAARARAAAGMELKLIAPADVVAGDRLPIDVSYHGAVPETFEMFLDGALVSKRQMSGVATRGIVSFSLDTMLLAEGDHSVRIRCIDTGGNVDEVSGRIHIPGIDLSAPVRIEYPSNGIEVSGVVPIKVGLSDSVARQSPYVSFFVDRQLKVLRNYPPYQYVWDTTTVSNGWHVLEAWTQLPDAALPFKARPVHVNVNNSGGATAKEDTVVDLRKVPGIRMPISAPAHGSMADVRPGVSGRSASARAGARSYADAMGARAQEPSGRSIASGGSARASLGAARPSVSGRIAPIVGSADAMGVRAQQPSAQRVASLPASEARALAIASSRERERRAAAAATAVPHARVSFRYGRVTSTHIPARMAGGAVETPHGKMMVASRPAATKPDLTQLGLPPLPAPAATAGLNERPLTLPRSGVFDVALNGAEIAFDVPPRFENGLALAPFRNIFEYTGGRLFWYPQSQTVHAVNSTREIELHIGSSEALVNNRPLEMAHRAYIDRGRTIVPLSFLSNVLDLSMSYDPKSGRLLLQSKK